MESYNDIEVFQDFCKLKNKYGIYIAYNSKDFSCGDIKSIVPFFSDTDYLWTRTMFLFDDKKERDNYFNKIYGKDESIGVKFDYDTRIYSKMIN
jgi:hypothetical protein